MFKLPRMRRAFAVMAAAVAVASGIVTTAGTAHADDPTINCGDYQGNTPGPPWYSWTVQPCIYYYPSSGTYYGFVDGWFGSTDVRAYVGVYDSCNGVTYGLNGDSDGNHWFPSNTDHYLFSAAVNISCRSGVWAIARITNNGDGSPWAWSTPLYG